LKQQRFAAKVAGGETRASSYRQIYSVRNKFARSVSREARRLAKVPLVAEKIKELRLALLPAPADLRAVRDHAVAVGIEVSNAAADPKVRLMAAQWLANVADQEAAAQQDGLLEELRALYLRAVSLAGQAGTPVEVVQQAEPVPEAGGLRELELTVATVDSLEGVEDTSEANPAPTEASTTLISDSTAADQCPTVPDTEKDECTQRTYRQVRVSALGHFPVRFRREPM
jgi:hypothetical protein